MLVVWERATGAPAKIIFSPYKNGVCALDMSPDMRYLATLSAPEAAVSYPCSCTSKKSYYDTRYSHSS